MTSAASFKRYFITIYLKQKMRTQIYLRNSAFEAFVNSIKPHERVKCKAGIV